ncbi:hypothetical protein CAPTEDRAFT_210844 [Capitella teleta]|uniref:Uncharacterized protein n=1 Tax=Capitella teleta TaxID=283909 RepID=R7U0Y3_CAPTE|nr:hypothetical protein CAPTEDRAFT_210844 [Capitella teleta]|eukprot:ELT99858.1 hypothetical protein CAPTEDRAFT_210844 [Capitella teleta]
MSCCFRRLMKSTLSCEEGSRVKQTGSGPERGLVFISLHLRPKRVARMVYIIRLRSAYGLKMNKSKNLKFPRKDRCPILVNYTGNEEGLFSRDVTVGLATISPSSVGVTITAPYTEDHLMYLMLIKPGKMKGNPVDDLESSGTDEDTEEGEDDDEEKNDDVMTTETPKDESQLDVNDNSVDYQQTEYVDVNRYEEDEEEETKTANENHEIKTEPKRKVPNVERSDSVVARDSGNDVKIQFCWLFVSICVILL